MNEPSPFVAYVGRNFTPYEPEMRELQHLLEDKRIQASPLAAKIEEAKADLLAMEAQHDAHLKFIQEHARLISPIHAVPLEVLTMIFDLCLEDYRRPYASSLSGGTCNTSHPSLVLSHVCRPWRDLVLETPHIWSYIYIQLPGIVDWLPEDDRKKVFGRWTRQAKRLSKLFKMWTKRTAGHPFSMRVEVKESRSFLF